MNVLAPEECAQLAGIWDCDGHIGIAKRAEKQYSRSPYYRGIAQIGQTKRELLDWVVDVTGTGKVYKQNSKPMYHLRIPERDLVMFLSQIKERLILKKRQAALVIALFQKISIKNNGYNKHLSPNEIARREGIYMELKQLNRKNPMSAYKTAPARVAAITLASVS